MQVIRFFLFITALLSGSVFTDLNAQEVQTNVRGEKIVVFKDGSWRPYQPADSVLLNQKEEFLIEDSNNDNPFEVPEDAKTKKNKSSKATKALEAQLDANKKEMQVLENKFYKFSQDPSIPAKDLEAIKNQLDELIAKEAAIKSELAGIPAPKQSDKTSVKETDNKATASSKTMDEKRLNVGFESPRNENSIINNTSCEIASSKVDDFSRQKRIELASYLLFTHTDPKLKPHLKTADFLTCQTWLSATNLNKYLNLEMTFMSATARKEYGAVTQGSLLIIRLVNGETLNLNSANFDNGQVDPNANTTVYRIQYVLPKAVIKKLLKTEIDKVRMVWSTGYEDYDVYHMRTIMEQLQCLQQIKI